MFDPRFEGGLGESSLKPLILSIPGIYLLANRRTSFLESCPTG